MQTACAYAHRGANLHPGGGLIRSGGRPAIALSRVCLGSEVFGIDQLSIERVLALEGVRAAVVEEHEQRQLLIVQTAPGLELTHAILSQLSGTTIGRVSSREPTLEDAYVQLVTAA